MTADQWFEKLFNFGLPTALLVVLVFLLVKAGKWVASTIVVPMVTASADNQKKLVDASQLTSLSVGAGFSRLERLWLTLSVAYGAKADALSSMIRLISEPEIKSKLIKVAEIFRECEDQMRDVVHRKLTEDNNRA